MYHPDRLPYYKTCNYTEESFDDIPYSYPFVSPQTQAMLDYTENWEDDCQPNFIRQCRPGYFATTRTSPVSGLTYLVQCSKCPMNSNCMGGFVGACMCDAGYATATALWRTVRDMPANCDPSVREMVLELWIHSDARFLPYQTVP